MDVTRKTNYTKLYTDNIIYLRINNILLILDFIGRRDIFMSANYFIHNVWFWLFRMWALRNNTDLVRSGITFALVWNVRDHLLIEVETIINNASYGWRLKQNAFFIWSEKWLNNNNTSDLYTTTDWIKQTVFVIFLAARCEINH